LNSNYPEGDDFRFERKEMKTIIVIDNQLSEEEANCTEYPHQYIFVNKGIERIKIVYPEPEENFTIYELPSGKEVNQDTIEWRHIYHMFYADMPEEQALEEWEKNMR
jgi:hypothetical protein